MPAIRMSVCLFLFLAISSYSCLAQDTIKSLHFPYLPGYELEMKGTMVTFDSYNFPSKTTEAALIYAFSEYTDTKNTIIKISFKQIHGTDTTTVDNTRLVMDTKGMTWWGVDKENHFDDKHKTLALALPLYKGKNWKTFTNDIPVQISCITVDTSITCPSGTFTCFGTRTNMPVKETKDYTVYVLVDEYYTDAVGRIMTVTTQFVYLKEKKRTLRIYEETLFTTLSQLKK